MAYSQFDRSSQAPDSLSPQAPKRSSARWFPLLGAGVGLVGLIAGVVGCSRPAASTEAAKPAYSEQQVADAKKAVCGIYADGLRALRASGSRKSDNPGDTLPTSAVNIRLAEVAVANALYDAVLQNPAAPSELTQPINQLSNIYQKIALIQLADGPREEFHPVALQADELIPKIDQICQ